jgi:hypothetical protein
MSSRKQVLHQADGASKDTAKDDGTKDGTEGKVKAAIGGGWDTG